MKKIKIFSLFIITSLTILISSCSKTKLDEINRNVNNATDVASKFIMTDVMTNTAFSVVGGDVSLYSSVYLEHEAGVWGQAWNAETRTGEPTQSTTNNNSWNSIYSNIKSLRIVIDKTSEGGSEEGNDVTLGIAKVLLAYNAAVLTDFFGDVPFSEAGLINPDGSPAVMQPKIDKQSEIYPQIQTLLDEAIVALAGTGGSFPIGKQDVIYGGDKASWIKAAYGLKARYTMHTLKRSTDVPGDLAKILDYISQSFESADEEMAFSQYDGGAVINPLFGISNARDMLGVSQSLANKFTTLEDPRGNEAFMDYNFAQITLAEAVTNSAPNGTTDQVQYEFPISAAEYSTSAPTMLLSYHELLFLKAEALIRLNRAAEAKDALKEAIIAAFANLENSLNITSDAYGLGFDIDLSEAVATTYFNDKVAARFDANPLKETMLQKYLAFYGASGEATEAFNDYRRIKALGDDALVTLENPLNTTQFPLRFPYGNSDVTANPVIKDVYGNGDYVYTENVWWAGGTR